MLTRYAQIDDINDVTQIINTTDCDLVTNMIRQKSLIIFKQLLVGKLISDVCKIKFYVEPNANLHMVSF